MAADEFYERFGSLLRTRRQAAKVTQDALATRLRLSRTTIVNIEKGRQRVALHQLLEMADALGCDPAHLIPPPPGADAKELHGTLNVQEADFVSRIKAQRRGVQ